MTAFGADDRVSRFQSPPSSGELRLFRSTCVGLFRLTAPRARYARPRIPCCTYSSTPALRSLDTCPLDLESASIPRLSC